jgi:chromosome partitioning protein
VIILIGGEKGGTGKTTVATNLAAIRASRGHDVLLVDTDKQGSASAWSDIRDIKKNDIRVPNIQKFGVNLTADIRDLESRYEDIIIDAGGRDSVELRAAMTIADKMFVPVQASQFDIWTLSIINDLVIQAKGFNPSLAPKVVINRAATNPSIQEVEEAKEVFGEFECLILSDNILKERIAYRKAAKNGLSVIEIEKQDAKSTQEIMALYEEVFNA